MLHSLVRKIRYKRLLRELRDDWTIRHEGVETYVSLGPVARYVVEQSGLGARRLRVVWRHPSMPKYQLSSPEFQRWLMWANRAEPIKPPRHEPEVAW